MRGWKPWVKVVGGSAEARKPYIAAWDAARVLGVSRETVAQLVELGTLRAVRWGRYIVRHDFNRLRARKGRG